MSFSYTKSASAFLAGIALFALASLFTPAAAQEAVSVKIQPAVIEENVDPGEVLTRTLRVTNEDASAKTFYLIVRDVTNVGTDGRPIFAEGAGTSEYGLATWIQFGAPSVTLKGGETKEVSFTIRVPQSPVPGGHFGGIFLSLEPRKLATTGTGIGFQVGTLLNLRVSGEAVEEARIREFSTDKNIYSDSEVQFTTRVENLGNVLVRPRGPLEIVNMFGQKLATITVNDEAAGIFPKTERAFTASWKPEGFAIGRFQATVALQYGENWGKTIYSSRSFWILPLGVLIPSLLGILIVILVIYIGIQVYVRKKIAEMQRAMGRTPISLQSRPVSSRLLFLTVGFLLFAIVLLGILFLVFK